MTLLVVDHFRMTADSYATVTEEDGSVRYENDFPKLFVLHGPLRFSGMESHPRLGFTGDAHTFLEFFKNLPYQDGGIQHDQLLAHARTIRGRETMVVIPFPGAVYTLQLGSEEVSETYQEGEVFAFGSAYAGVPYDRFEYRAWFSIFRESIDLGLLPGPELHFLHHRADQSAPIKDTLRTKTRPLTRFPFARHRRAA